MTLSLQVLKIPDDEVLAQREFYSDDTEISIGRDFTCTVTLPDSTASLSRTHFVIRKKTDGTYSISDMSTNGTLINEKMMGRGTVLTLNDGDLIQLGSYRLLIGLMTMNKVNENVTRVDIENIPTPDSTFGEEVDLSSNQAILAGDDAYTEPEMAQRGFSRTEVPLTPELMHDPFDEGPKIKESETGQYSDVDVKPRHFESIVPEEVLDSPSTLPVKQKLPYFHQNNRYDLDESRSQNMLAEAIPKAFERLLEELDPNSLEKEYNDYVSGWLNVKKRFWQIHKKHFRRKKEDGTYLRLYMAYVAEEIRKL